MTEIEKTESPPELWMFIDKGSLVNNYGSLDDCLEIAQEYLRFPDEADDDPRLVKLLQDLKELCLDSGKYENDDFSIFKEG